MNLSVTRRADPAKLQAEVLALRQIHPIDAIEDRQNNSARAVTQSNPHFEQMQLRRTSPLDLALFVLGPRHSAHEVGSNQRAVDGIPYQHRFGLRQRD